MELTCPRCGSALRPIDDAPPPFCAHCGLPQLRVSPDAQAYPVPAEAAPATDAAAAGDGTDWPAALRLVAGAAVLGIVPAGILPGALAEGALGGPSLLLSPMLTLAVVTLYHRSRPRRRIDAAIGARIGALLGLALGYGVALLTGVAGFVMRYGYHSHTVDDKVQQASQQVLQQLATAGPVPQDVTGFLQSPAFRAGSFLAGHVFFAVLLVVVCSVCGWIAGTLLKSRRQRSVGRDGGD